MDALVGFIREVTTQYGLPVALCVVIIGAQGFFLWKLWQRNQTLLDQLLGNADGDATTPEERKKRRASLHDLDEAHEKMRDSVRVNIEQLLQTLHTTIGAGDDREVERLTKDLERLRDDLAAERKANTSLHEKRFEDVRALHAEQIETMRTATQAIEKLSAMLQGAMRRTDP